MDGLISERRIFPVNLSTDDELVIVVFFETDESELKLLSFLFLF